MAHELDFSEQGQAEWDGADGSIKKLFRQALKKRLEQPRVPGSKLDGHPDLYKIKLRKEGYRLLYQVFDKKLVVMVVGVARRDGIYDDLLARIQP